LVGIGLLSLAGCSDGVIRSHPLVVEDTTAPPPLSEKGPVSLPLGQGWLYREEWIMPGLRAITSEPDTVVIYRYFLAEKDTSIDGLDWRVVASRDRLVGRDSVWKSQGRSAYHWSDSGLTEIELNQPMSIGLFGRVAANSNGLDTAGIWDVVTPLAFPLQKDSVYAWRTWTARGASVVHRKYLGTETIATPQGKVSAWKFTWLTEEYVPATETYKLTDWVDRSGLVRREADYGLASVTNVDGLEIGQVRSLTNTWRVGPTDILEDTLVPWGRR